MSRDGKVKNLRDTIADFFSVLTIVQKKQQTSYSGLYTTETIYLRIFI